MGIKSPVTPHVALTMRISHATSYVEPRDCISHDWLDRLGKWGMLPLLIPNSPKQGLSFLDVFIPDIIVITGGDEIGRETRRDSMENMLMEHAIDNLIPVLGVCRGVQFLNHYFGGSLSSIDGHVGGLHDVRFPTDWAEFYGNNASVNSYHETVIPAGSLAPELCAKAFDENGYVEALVHRNLPIAGVMWHPERDGAPVGDRQLIERMMDLGNGGD